MPTVMCGQLRVLKFSSTVCEYCNWVGAVWPCSVSSQNVALTLVVTAFGPWAPPLLAGHVELEEVVLVRRVVGPPDDVEASAAPFAYEPGERAQGARHVREGLLSRVFHRRQRLKREIR